MSHQPEKVILTNMCMIYDENGNVLVQDRKKSWCGIAFPGGHVEPLESIVDSTIREVKEETGLHISDLQFCGVKQWQHNDVRNIVFLFKTDVFTGTLHSTEEGENFWVNLENLDSYELAENFEVMLHVFLDEDISEHYLKNTETGYIDLLK